MPAAWKPVPHRTDWLLVRPLIPVTEVGYAARVKLCALTLRQHVGKMRAYADERARPIQEFRKMIPKQRRISIESLVKVRAVG